MTRREMRIGDVWASPMFKRMWLVVSVASGLESTLGVVLFADETQRTYGGALGTETVLSNDRYAGNNWELVTEGPASP
jgi:hypothetical protein